MQEKIEDFFEYKCVEPYPTYSSFTMDMQSVQALFTESFQQATFAESVQPALFTESFQENIEWNDRVNAWAYASLTFGNQPMPSWKDLLAPEPEMSVKSNLLPVFEECVSASPVSPKRLETPPPKPFHIEPNHYVSVVPLERIREQIEAFCCEFKASFEFIDMDTYTYKCIYINQHQSECKFWINLFTDAEGIIIENQRMSGDGFAFIDVVRCFRHWLQINEVISNPNEPPYKRIEEMKLSAGLPPSPAMFIEPYLVKQTVQSMIDSAYSLYFDVATETMTALADTSSQPDILEAIVSNLRTRELLYMRLSSEETHNCYCALVIIKNILVAYPEKKYLFVNLFPEVIYTMHRHTLPQIWEKCTEILLLLGEPIESEDMVAILKMLRSNPFPTLAPLALKLEAL